MYRFLLLIIIVLQFPFASSSQLSDQANIYLLTCEVGDEVYEQFGHSALRIADPINQIDVVFNWGLFSFGNDEIEFMMKFTRGKLDYFMGGQSLEDFLYDYQEQKRDVRQLKLNMSLEQKNKLWSALIENYKEENKAYRYDFFYQNCATLIKDHLVNALGADLQLATHPQAGLFSFREIIDKGFRTHPWTCFGIDLVLGSPIDKVADNNDIMFSPLKMEQVFLESTIAIKGVKEPFVLQSDLIIKGIKRKETTDAYFTPVVLSIVLLIFTIALWFFKLDKLARIWGGLLFFIVALIGVLLVFMWWGTDHQTARANYNLLWANPLLLIFVVAVFSTKFHKKLHKVYNVMSYFMFALVLFFMMLPQEFHPASRVLIITLAFQYYIFMKDTFNKKEVI